MVARGVAYQEPPRTAFPLVFGELGEETVVEREEGAPQDRHEREVVLFGVHEEAQEREAVLRLAGLKEVAAPSVY